jgi:hypothetical protein
VAVRADKFALPDFGEDQRLVVTAHEGAHVVELLESRQVIPGHRGVVKRMTAVGARSARLQLAIPLNDAPMLGAFLRESRLPRPAVIRAVITPTTGLAPGLTTATASVELIERLEHTTKPASLHRTRS